MALLSRQKELSEQLAELLVACITKSYAMCTCRSHRRSNYVCIRRFVLKPKCSSGYSACFFFIVKGMYQDATELMHKSESCYLKFISSRFWLLLSILPSRKRSLENKKNNMHASWLL